MQYAFCKICGEILSNTSWFTRLCVEQKWIYVCRICSALVRKNRLTWPIPPYNGGACALCERGLSAEPQGVASRIPVPLAYWTLGFASAVSGYAVASRRTWAPTATLAAGVLWLIACVAALALHGRLDSLFTAVCIGVVAYWAVCVALVTHRMNRHEFERNRRVIEAPRSAAAQASK